MHAAVWPPMETLNRELLQKNSGQQPWKGRVEAWDRFAAERAWQTLAEPLTLNEQAAMLAGGAPASGSEKK